MKSGKITLIVPCVIFSALAILFGAGFVFYAGTNYSEDQYSEQTCTFLDYDHVVRVSTKGLNSEWYDIYVQEHEKPLQIDQIVFDQINKSVLFDLNEGDEITVLLDKKNKVISMAHDGQYALTYEDYVAEHERNNTVGIFASLIMCGMSVGIIIFLVAYYKQYGKIDIL